jgi:hypothetical protein
MTSSTFGTDPPSVKVTNISRHGFWLRIDGTEYFLSFETFPWFREATVAAILYVERLHGEHLRWPALDVDLELDSIRDPAKYPLIAQGDTPSSTINNH